MTTTTILANPLRSRCLRALAAHRARAKREGFGILPYRLADLEATLMRETEQLVAELVHQPST